MENNFITKHVASPITGEKAKYVTTIETSFICEQYFKMYQIDVTKYFKNISNVLIYKCQQTDFKFYFPENISGDSAFYKALEKHPWYYSPWKWEHIFTTKFIRNGQNILEIGCGQGAFLSKIQQDFEVKTLGLELNEDADFYTDIQFRIESIEEHVKSHFEKYDLVCSFHVLEHVSKVDSFIKSSLSVLKKDGLMVIAVPNNDTFIKNDLQNVLNMPPHHVGLWTEKSLKKLSEIYPIKLVKIKTEPLQKSQLSWYFDVFQSKYKIKINKFILKIIKRLMIPFLFLFRGQTVIVVFKKLN